MIRFRSAINVLFERGSGGEVEFRWCVEQKGENMMRGIRWISVYVNLLISAFGFIFVMCLTSMH